MRFGREDMMLFLAFVLVFVSPIADSRISNLLYAANVDRPLVKATWIWNTSTDLLLDNQVGTFQTLQQNGVNLVYLQIDPDLATSTYSNFVREASARGIEIHALGGAPDWILPDKQVKLYKLINWVKTYNGGVAAEERFTGIHLDVEPFVLQAWHADTDTMLGLWRDTMSGFVEEMKIETPQLTAGADLPVWLDKFMVQDGLGGRTTLSNWMLQRLDQTTLMAYRDNVPDIISSISNELSEAENNGKSIIVALETLPSTEGPISYYDKGRLQMLQDLSVMGETLKDRASFAGYAIHDYEGLTRLKE
jgi:hypothetical protein